MQNALLLLILRGYDYFVHDVLHNCIIIQYNTHMNNDRSK